MSDAMQMRLVNQPRCTCPALYNPEAGVLEIEVVAASVGIVLS
jgi:hypothetical protein